MIGAFIFYVGLLGLMINYLGIKMFRLRKLYLYIFILIPIAIVVFSILNRFKVLLILEESFIIMYVTIQIIYMEV